MLEEPLGDLGSEEYYENFGKALNFEGFEALLYAKGFDKALNFEGF